MKYPIKRPGINDLVACALPITQNFWQFPLNEKLQISVGKNFMKPFYQAIRINSRVRLDAFWSFSVKNNQVEK